SGMASPSAPDADIALAIGTMYGAGLPALAGRAAIEEGVGLLGAAGTPGVIGEISVPAGAKFGTTTFGDAMHLGLPKALERAFPEAEFTFNVKRGQTGVDVTRIEPGSLGPDWGHAE